MKFLIDLDDLFYEYKGPKIHEAGPVLSIILTILIYGGLGWAFAVLLICLFT